MQTGDYFESEILPTIGTDNGEKKSKKKLYKPKMKCNQCGHIGYELVCPECKSPMFKYKKPFLI